MSIPKGGERLPGEGLVVSARTAHPDDHGADCIEIRFTDFAEGSVSILVEPGSAGSLLGCKVLLVVVDDDGDEA